LGGNNIRESKISKEKKEFLDNTCNYYEFSKVEAS